MRGLAASVKCWPREIIWWSDLVEGQPPHCEPEWMNAEDPLFLLYTSGSTGKPKGIQHSSAGYLLNAKLTSRWVFDLQEDDVFWCTADVGWVTGHTYVAYGPLAAGATVVMYEGAPNFPDGGRFWKICETHGVTVFYTAPTAIRALMRLGDEIPGRYDLSKLRLLGTVGEPINPEAWMWYHRVVGKERCPIVDTWWQTETGSIMMTPIPGVTPTKPGSCTRPLPGIFADIVDDEGRPIQKADAGGYLVIKRPWPSMLRTIWGDNHRYLETYWHRFQNRYYVAGDSAHRDADGYYWIMGRIDDVLNVAGHRLGTMEIESALVAHPQVAEAAVVSRAHEIKGESVFAYVVLNIQRPVGDGAKLLVTQLRDWVGEQLSPIAKPDDIRLTDNLPKTRSGKIMRRLLRAIARGEEITQDVSTLENPAIIEQLRGSEDRMAALASAESAARSKPARRKSGAPTRAAPTPAARKPAAKAKVPVPAARKSAAKAEVPAPAARKRSARAKPGKSDRAKPDRARAATKTRAAVKARTPARPKHARAQLRANRAARREDPVDDAFDLRIGDFSRRAFDRDRRAHLPRRRPKPHRRRRLESGLWSRLLGGIRTRMLRIRAGAPSTGRAVCSAPMVAQPRLAGDAAGVSFDVRSLSARPHQDGRAAPDVGRRKVLGIRAPARQRQSRRYPAVRRLSRLGGR